MRDGVSLLDQCASAANGSVTLESVYASLGLAGEKRTAELMQAIAEQDTAKALTIFSALYSAGKDVSALLGEMCALCRDLLVLRTAPKSGLSMLSGLATEQQALALQSVFSPGELMRVLTETQKTRVSFGKNTDVRVAAELLLMQLCEPSLRLDAQALDARISRVEEQLASGVLVKSAPKASRGEHLMTTARPSRTMRMIRNAGAAAAGADAGAVVCRAARPKRLPASGPRCRKSCAQVFRTGSAAFSSWTARSTRFCRRTRSSWRRIQTL